MRSPRSARPRRSATRARRRSWRAGWPAVEVPQRDLADLLGVDLRRFQRWISARERTRPEGEEARRLRALARLVGQLRHAFTPAGVVAWFDWPRPELGGATPRELLADPVRLPDCCSPPARRGAPRSRDGRRGGRPAGRERGSRLPARVVAAAAADRAEPGRRPLPPRHGGVADAVPLPAPARAVGRVPARVGAAHGEQLALVRHRTWALRLELDGLVRIGFEEAAEHGLRPGDLVSDDHRACHRLADRLRAAGAPGAIVPSAALPGTENVVLFGERAAAPYLLEPVSGVDVPASLTADGGRPPLGRARARPPPRRAARGARGLARRASRSASTSRAGRSGRMRRVILGRSGRRGGSPVPAPGGAAPAESVRIHDDDAVLRVLIAVGVALALADASVVDARAAADARRPRHDGRGRRGGDRRLHARARRAAARSPRGCGGGSRRRGARRGGLRRLRARGRALLVAGRPRGDARVPRAAGGGRGRGARRRRSRCCAAAGSGRPPRCSAPRSGRRSAAR